MDVDPQGSLSQGFFGSAEIEGLAAEMTLAVLFDDNTLVSSLQSIIQPTSVENVALAPANQHLAPFNTPSPEAAGMRQCVLREFLESASGYDIVLIDCPPNLYLCSWAAMVAADYVLIPVPPEDFGTQGLRAVHQAIENARALNPRLRRLGHLITRSDRRLLIHRSYAPVVSYDPILVLLKEYDALYRLVIFRMTSLDRRAPIASATLAASLATGAVLPSEVRTLFLITLPAALIWFLRTTVNHARSFEDVLARLAEIERAVNEH